MSQGVKIWMTFHQAYPTTNSQYPQKHRNYNQASADPYAGCDQREWKSNKEPQYIWGCFQNTSARVSSQADELHEPSGGGFKELRKKLQRKNNFLTFEKELRIEKDDDLQKKRDSETDPNQPTDKSR